MKAIAIALLAFVLSFCFLHKPFVMAFGGRMKFWKVLIFDLVIALSVYLIAR